MTTAAQPKTRAEFFALPEGGLFGAEERTLEDGRIVRVPLEFPAGCLFPEPDTVLLAFDAEGVRWRLGAYASGELFRMRVSF